MTTPDPTPLPEQTLHALVADSLILCATQRLAQTLSRTHDHAVSLGSGWQSLQATTPDLWFNHLYAALDLRGLAPPALDGVRVLNAFQEQIVWEQIIRGELDTGLEPLFDLKSLAASASQAHRLAIQWGIPVNASTNSSEEQRQFVRWQHAFRHHCQKHRIIDSTRMQACLIDHLPDMPRSLLKPQIAFSGFDHYTVLEQRLQTQLSRMGIPLCQLSPPNTPAQIHRVAPADLDTECNAIAVWAQRHLSANKDIRLGIVVPDLAMYQYPLQDALEDRLSPGYIAGLETHKSHLFNISLGQPLASAALVQTALILLQVVSSHHDIEQPLIAHLLHSAYWSKHQQEADAHARLDAAFRASIAIKAPLQRFVDFSEWFLTEHQLNAPGLRQHFAALMQAPKRMRGDKLPSEWRRLIESTLATCGWLHEGKLNSIEFQTRQAFVAAIAELGKLDLVTGRCTLNDALGLLRQLCQDKLFQPKTQGSPPIQILGMLESTGLEFDALWVAGLTESQWPPPARPNPLLSIPAQRATNTPNASALIQLEFARQIQNRLMRSARDITLSAPASDGDTEFHPSPLISEVPLSPLPEIPPAPWVTDFLQRRPDALTRIDDATAPAVDAGSRVRGGTWLLRAQAICPAWGYFQFRLGASPLQTPVEGLDARKRGTLVHNALETFWIETRDLTTLQTLTRSGLPEAIERAVAHALEKHHNDKRNEPLKPRQLRLERERLCRLLDSWLRMEAERKESFSVLHTEHEFNEVIGGIEVRMFIDRIDQLTDGRILIVDYKTGGHIDTRNWASDRLTEPQLPIYAAIAQPSDGDIAGVAFAQVHLAKLGFKGIGEAIDSPAGIDDLRSDKARKTFDSTRFPDWKSVLNHWRQAVHDIAAEVCRGDAGVRFANDKDLLYCDVRPLLRLSERASQLEAHNIRQEGFDA